MKKPIIAWLISILLAHSFIAGEYTPSPSFQRQVEESQEIIQQHLNQTHHDEIDELKQRFQDAKSQFKGNPKILYAISQRIETIQNHKHQVDDSFETVSSSEFFDRYWGDIVSDLNLSDRCTKYYDEIDEIAQANNFPTELVIATWYREYSCILWNPDNGDGPFQILSKDYEPGEISIDEFQDAIQDFIDFSKDKRHYFHNNPALRERFEETNIDINHDSYSLRDIRLHSILYNGIISWTTLENNMYANGNLSPEYSSPRDGIVTSLLKVIHRKENR